MTTTDTVDLTDADYTAFVCPFNWVGAVRVVEQGEAASSGWYLKAPTLADDPVLKAPGAPHVFRHHRGGFWMQGDIMGYGKIVDGDVEFAMESES